MGRGTFALTSCVAAVPGGILTVVLVLAFLNHVGDMSIVPMILAGLTLAISSFLVVTPFGILVFGGPKKKKSVAAKSPKDQKPVDEPVSLAGESVAEEVDMEASGEAHVLDSDADAATAIGSDVELDDTTAFDTPASTPEFELADSDTFGTAELESMDEIVDEVVLEDEDDEPKKKKKRR